MRKFKGSIGTNAQGSDFEFEFEVDDDATDEQVEHEAMQAAFDYINWHYYEVKAAKRQGGAE